MKRIDAVFICSFVGFQFIHNELSRGRFSGGCLRHASQCSICVDR